MDIGPGHKQEGLSPVITGSDHSGTNIGSASSAGGGDIQEAGMNIPLLPSSGEGDALTLLPEVQATGRPIGSKRPFQRRRRSRACDACRARKTKCDTPDHGSCSACVSASLVCKFSGGEDRRRAGPARRVRVLENTVQELTRKLAEAEHKLQQTGLSGSDAAESLTEKHPHSPMTSTTEPSITSTSPPFSGSSSTRDPGICRSWHGDVIGYINSQKGKENKEGRFQEDGTSWDHHMFGPSSCPSFLYSYKDYLSRLGYRPPPVANPQEAADGPPPSSPGTRIPNLLAPNKFLPFDLRALLPPIGLARQLIETFRMAVQNYTPIFYWPSLEKKIERAWSMPIWDGDSEAVRSVFCVIVMLLAVASQFLEPEELDNPEGGDWGGTQERLCDRNGWMFFEFGRKYSNLNNPDYTIDDAIFLLLMAFYLDKAFLPSPCWMITGAMARVCQDIGIYRRTPPGLYNDVEIEARTRLFWAAYIQDRKISMKLGRPVIFLDQHINVGLPGLPGVVGKQEEESETQGTAGGQGGTGAATDPEVADMEDRQSSYSDETTRISLQVFKATIYVAKTSEGLLNISLKRNGGDEDINRLQAIDEMLKKAWEAFPTEFTDLSRFDALDLPAVRPLFHLQHSRIILYRYFTDFTSSPALPPEFRTFCLAQSIQVSKITSHILSRVSQNPKFDRHFGLRTDELVHIHTFRAATVLLLGHHCHDPSLLSVSTEEVDLCARALRSVARSNHLGQKLLKLFEDFAKMFGYQIGLAGESTSEQKSEPEVIPITSPIQTHPWSNIPSTQSTSLAHHEYGSPVLAYNDYHSTHTPRWITSTSAPAHNIPQVSDSLHSTHAHAHQQHTHSHVGLAFMDSGMEGDGIPTAVNAGPGPGSEDQAPLPQIDWDAYQQMLQFDPNFEVYMSGPSDRHYL